MTFNADLSEGRYELLNSLYDRLITFRLKELNAAWKAIHDAEAKAASAEAKRLIAEARKLATTVPISEKEASDPAIAGAFQEVKAGPEGRRPPGRVRSEVGRGRLQELRRGQGAGGKGAEREVSRIPGGSERVEAACQRQASHD